MIFEDVGILVHKQKYSETSLILTIFTENYGLQKGILKGGMNPKVKSYLEIGNILNVVKKARNESSLGYFKLELQKSYLADVLYNSIKTAALVSICTLINNFLAEKEPYADLFYSTKTLISLLSQPDFIKYYLKWEVLLLNYIGLGLDLSQCVVTNNKDNLYYISPRTGKAVVKGVGEPYKDKLFVIPELLKSNNLQNYEINNNDSKQVFTITSHFFNHFSQEYHTNLPFSRQILIKNFCYNVK